MKKIILLFATVLLGGCAVGINHSVVTVNDKQYIAETHMRNFLGLVQWSEKTEYKEVLLGDTRQVEGPEHLYKITGEINKDTKTVLQAIYNECDSGRRNSFEVKKCIKSKIKSLK